MSSENFHSWKIVRICGLKAFTKFVKKTQVQSQPAVWKCCGKSFHIATDIHRHASQTHNGEVESATGDILQNGTEDRKWKHFRKQIQDKECKEMEDLVKKETTQVDFASSVFPWLPDVDDFTEDSPSKSGRILLFYKYTSIEDPLEIKNWQEELCKRLRVTGKIRIASEGINGTLGGSTETTQLYIDSMLAHPLFSGMVTEDFKTSPGSALDFPDGLKVGVYEEIVPIGIPPGKLSYADAGAHLTPEEFHQAVENHLKAEDNSVFIDCRNFYESKIGIFNGAVAPDVRKFSYFPEYVDKNLELFKDKKVYMYCTGGIRCERGSAYLKSKGVCEDVFQLKGGIHKYLDKYPEGHYRGKLFVFDNRYAIKYNNDVIASCVYCRQPWDRYQPCSSQHCHQLVLACDSCRNQRLTACCKTCQKHSEEGITKEECECTQQRERIPEDLPAENTD